MRGGNAYLELFMEFMRSCYNLPWYLDYVHIPSRKPWSLERSQKLLLDYQGSNTCWEAKHFVEADSHGVDIRIFCQRKTRGGSKSSGIENNVVSEGGRICDNRKRVFSVGDV